MGYQTWIADQCRSFGLRVEEYPGWTNKGSSSFYPEGVVDHWTAGPCGSTGRPSLNTCAEAGNSSTPAPLCNVYLDRDGIAVVVAAGKANHAGEGGWQGLSGNSSVFGIEAECCNAGDWTQAQLYAYPILNAALLSGIGKDASWAFRHCDWAPDRKIDTHDLPLEWIQSQTAAALDAGGSPGEGIFMALTDDEQNELLYKVRQLVRSGESTGRIASADGTGGQQYVFFVKEDGWLHVAKWNDNGGWTTERLTGYHNPRMGVSVVPERNGMIQCYTVNEEENIIVTQWNGWTNSWEWSVVNT